MQVDKTNIDGVLILSPRIFMDDRGSFNETYRRDAYSAAGVDADFVQDNHSCSAKGVLRGLHFQNPRPQGKLVQVISGAIFDVAVDVRRGSPSFGQWTGVELTDANQRQLWVPPGFAHGFLSLQENTHVVYKCTDYYAPQHENTLLWNDPAIDIAWPVDGLTPRLSQKDAAGLLLADLP